MDEVKMTGTITKEKSLTGSINKGIGMGELPSARGLREFPSPAYSVNGADLTAVGEAIAEKAGTEKPVFPDGWKEAVEGITGGDVARSILDRTITDFKDDKLTSLGKNAFAGCSLNSFDCPNLSTIKTQAFTGITKMPATLSLPGLTYSEAQPFYNIKSEFEITCENLEAISFAMFQYSDIVRGYFPKMKTVESSGFHSCEKLTHIYAPIAEAIKDNTFYKCTALTIIDLPKAAYISQGAFSSSALCVLILRNSSLCALRNISAFNNTPFAANGTGGTIYSPAALIESYQTATNWSTLYAAGNCNFVAIEGSEYE